ncbi:type I-F CRISPR-associated helicase Cas3f [Acinetobacter sp. ANC 3926]|uniref:CRISPR-associated helicase cas3, subtype I-f/ypest n=1 Tax=Acinetobacter genomosp. 15BJ TaxID=106651 RepID=R9B1Z8_9GAMM|nr:type I-F CRISPR-associated helicase Cas3f [Acinetobacter genomosp. 15BJ]EOR06421.1 CRISPR-associated helicase cas3, subtype I-f/ypest [Acinetobacter genomosp. 15BJ]MCH7293173.1 type I-F CRISPR-associated helicase Cas3f [Acinetobacter genomosp. 15BJ]
MHVIINSACEKRALKKTRAILDSYAIRTGHSSWQAPMTMDGLKEIRSALKKVATRQTAVAAYINFGVRRMKLVWVVGAKHKFAHDGAYLVASTKKQQKLLMLDEWVKASSLLAGAAGDMHDIGKASQHFQNKLSPEMAGQKIRDDIRHEWLSLKLLQQLRKNGWDWQLAWNNLGKGLDKFTLGERQEIEQGIQNELEAVDYLIVTHHGLLGVEEALKNDPLALPHYENHVRKLVPSHEQMSCAGELPDSIFKSHQKRMQRLTALISKQKTDPLLYWKALALHSRAALIHADHIVSAQQYSLQKPENISLFANTKLKTIDPDKKAKLQDQPLEWHLHQVGDRASRIAVQMMTDLSLSGLSEQTVEYICQPTTHPRFQWQNIAANALQKNIQKHPETPALVFNIAGTGSGKTRMNLRAACTLRPDDPRLAIALNLRSLTLQTGHALKTSMNLSEDEIAVIIGDTVTQTLFDQSKEKIEFVDEDENHPEPMFDAWGEDCELPEWLHPLFTVEKNGRKVLDQKETTILASPLLVSTIDYLIAAGEPHRQGHHVKALLRIISSDLILDEVDGYEPKALIAVLRLVQLTALYGRNVICSSATLSLTVAKTIHRAFESGMQMRAALYGTEKKSSIAIIDNELKPQVWLEQSNQKSEFNTNYQKYLDNLQAHLLSKPTHRLAQLLSLRETTVLSWKQSVLEGVKQLHQVHAWHFKKTEKKISLGLIRVANIKHAIRLAQFLSDHLPEANIACYHANDWLISRFYKEQRLDQLLTRHKDGKKRKTGNEQIEQDDEMIDHIQKSNSLNNLFIVIATPVEEVGRDHDFDWAIIDASSVQSIVQTAGRVNRHRLEKIQYANIMIPQWNYRYCEQRDIEKNKQQTKQRRSVFVYPGYEGYVSSITSTYSSQDLSELLPWDNQSQLVINARLRFDQLNCLFAKYDDQQIKSFCQNYFNDQGEQLFSRGDVDASIMTENIYNLTPLRERNYQETYRFEWAESLVVKKQVYGFDEKATKTLKYPKYGLVWDQVVFEEIPAKPQAWLALDPQHMQDYCDKYHIANEQGCRISLTPYNRDEVPTWSYDYGFGVMQKS